MTQGAQPAGGASSRALSGPTLVVLGALAIAYAPLGLRYSEFGPQATAFWRLFLSLPAIAVLAHFNGGVGRPDWRALLCGAFFALDLAFWHPSLLYTSVANATFIVNLGNVATALIAWVALGERPGRFWPLAAAVAVAGAWLLSSGRSGGATASLQGDLLSAVAAGMVAFYLFFGALARKRQSAWSVLFWSTASACGLALAFSLTMQEKVLPAEAHWLLTPLALALVAQVLGQGLILAGVGRTTPSFAGLLLLVQPVAAALAAWAAFGESLAPAQLLGCGLILVGIQVMQLR
jgi:drug/metabolite transporter (DMT)-like permease